MWRLLEGWLGFVICWMWSCHSGNGGLFMASRCVFQPCVSWKSEQLHSICINYIACLENDLWHKHPSLLVCTECLILTLKTKNKLGEAKCMQFETMSVKYFNWHRNWLFTAQLWLNNDYFGFLNLIYDKNKTEHCFKFLDCTWLSMTANFQRCNYELISCFVISSELINIEREADFFFFSYNIFK